MHRQARSDLGMAACPTCFGEMQRARRTVVQRVFCDRLYSCGGSAHRCAGRTRCFEACGRRWHGHSPSTRSARGAALAAGGGSLFDATRRLPGTTDVQVSALQCELLRPAPLEMASRRTVDAPPRVYAGARTRAWCIAPAGLRSIVPRTRRAHDDTHPPESPHSLLPLNP